MKNFVQSSSLPVMWRHWNYNANQFKCCQWRHNFNYHLGARFLMWTQEMNTHNCLRTHAQFHVSPWRCVHWKVHPWLEMNLQRQDLTLNSLLLHEQALQDCISNDHTAGNTCWYVSWWGITFLKTVPSQQKKKEQIPEGGKKKKELNYIRDTDETYSISNDDVVE